MNKPLVTKKRILVADDDPAILEVITLMLEDAGYEVITSINGEVAEIFKGRLPDLILMDIWMSGKDGREICRHLRKRKKTKQVPIIMISASKDAEENAIKAGATDFLAKPFEMNALLAMVGKYT